MPETFDKMSELPELKVMVRNSQGKYLAQDPNGLFFTDDRASAVVLRYQADHVSEQLESIRRVYGVALVADPYRVSAEGFPAAVEALGLRCAVEPVTALSTELGPLRGTLHRVCRG